MDSIDTWSVSDLLLLPDFCKIMSLTPIPCWSWHDIWFVQNIKFQMKSALFSNWCMHLFVKNIERSNYEHCMGVVKLLRYYQRWRLIKGGLVNLEMQRKIKKLLLILHSLTAIFLRGWFGHGRWRSWGIPENADGEA